MIQLTQNLKNGEMKLVEVPFPALHEGWVLVRNHFSLVSAGTEGKTVSDARKGLVGKALARKNEVEKVIRSAKTNGWMKTYRMVMEKLDTPVPLGYSCAGEVLAVGPGINDLKVGDLVTCGGNTANHAEVIAVPRNLCAPVPDGVSADAAAMTIMGSIALQGVRQAELHLGESCAVIGLGLLGQITLQLLEASGVKAIGIDTDPSQVQIAVDQGYTAIQRSNEFLHQMIAGITNGIGADAVIITAATTSDDPVNLAGELARQKGKIVVVGAVPTGFRREHYFRKELDLRMSCSYGPGRYDAAYEELGMDYPAGYVRWTENRNMQAFLELVSKGKVQPGKLITHRIDFSEAKTAFDMVVNRTEKFGGIVLCYDTGKQLISKIQLDSGIPAEASLPVTGLLGAGSFAQNVLLPAIRDLTSLHGLVTSKPHAAGHLVSKYQFKICSGDARDLFNDPIINTIVIATRHDSHAGYVIEGLKSGKHVFVEKPLCMNEEELELIRTTCAASNRSLMTGFNRRFSPLTVQLKSELNRASGVPVAINYRINAGQVPPNHWVHDPLRGGGRIIGEVCHFIDLSMYLAGSPIESVSAVNMNDPFNNLDTLNISLRFVNGSIAGISYFSNGSKKVSKEYLEVFYGNKTAVIDDFITIKISGEETIQKKLPSQDKGHNHSFRAFYQSIREGSGSPVPFSDQYQVMLTTFRVLESIRNNGERIFLNR